MNQLIAKILELSLPAKLLLMLVLSGLFYGTMFDSGADIQAQIDGLGAKKTDADARLKKAKADATTARKFKADMENFDRQMRDLLSFLPADPNTSDLLDKIRLEAQASGAQLQSLTPQGRSEAKEFYETRGIELKLSGTYSQIVLFLANLSKLSRLVTFKELSIRPTDKIDDVENPKLKFTGSLLVYRYIEPEEPKLKPGGANGAK